MGCSIRFYGNSYLAVINYGRIIFRGKSFCFQAYVWIGVSACVTTKTADRMAAICAFNCDISGAVGNGIHHFQTAADSAKTNRFVSFCLYSSACAAVVNGSADDQATTFCYICLHNMVFFKFIISNYDDGYIFCGAVGYGIVVASYNSASAVVACNYGVSF